MSSDSKSKVLFVAHVPPPNHGAAIVGERVLSIISKIYDCKLLRLSNSKSISSMGKGRTLSNVIFVLALYLKTFLSYILSTKNNLYYPEFKWLCFFERFTFTCIVLYLFVFFKI